MNVVFDFGAVLFSWRPAEILAEVFPERAATHPAAAQLAHAVFAHADWHAFDQGLLDTEAIVSRTAVRLGLPTNLLADLVNGIGERLRPITQTVELLDGLRQRRDAQNGIEGLYYLSNMPLPYARYLEERHPFLGWFDGGIFSGDVQLIKPDPAIYQTLQRRFDLQAADIVFIDDLKANVHAAQAQGWKAIHFTSAEQLAQELPQHLA